VAAPTIDQLMQGVATNLKTITGLRVFPYIADQINPPTAIIEAPHVVDYHTTFGRGKIVYELNVTIVQSATVDRLAMIGITKFADVAGANSVITAIESDTTLGGLVGTGGCYVKNGFRMQPKLIVNGLEYFGGTWGVWIVAQGS
jgi:hypothetical protein